MTDRFRVLNVLLDKEYRDDDAESIIEAIRMIKGVIDVVELVADPNFRLEIEIARNELAQKLWDVLHK